MEARGSMVGNIAIAVNTVEAAHAKASRQAPTDVEVGDCTLGQSGDALPGSAAVIQRAWAPG